MLRGHTTSTSRGPFALWIDAPPPWLATNALDHGTDSLDHANRSCSGRAGCIALPRNGSGALTAADCTMVSHSRTYRRDSIPTLEMTLVPKNASRAAVEIKLTATFAAAGPDPRLLLSLRVQNTGSAPFYLQTAFPLLRGINVGAVSNGSDDLGLVHHQTGLPDMPAWGGCPVGSKHIAATADSCGGMLGFHHTSMWQQVYAADGSQGLAVIADDSSGQPRMMGRFGDGPTVAPASGGAIYSMRYPSELVLPRGRHNGSAITPVAMRAYIIPHSGGWRAGALLYRDWLRSAGGGQHQKAWFLEHTHSKASCWFPSPAQVEQNKKSQIGMTSFTQLYELMFLGNMVDMIECAMWWEMPEPDAYGSYSADGIFKVRDDLGGARALAEGIRRVRAAGRRVQLYISADIVHRGSRLFDSASGWTSSRWAMWWNKTSVHQDDGNGGGAINQNATYMCHALERWKTTVANAVSRTVRDTSCDGVRLDGITNSNHESCWNPAHSHANPFADQGNQADLAILNASRVAMDRALPGGEGAEVLLSTEGFGDLYNLHGDTALMTWIGYPKGSDISPARITMPSFIGCTYGPYENVARAALDGWLLASASSPLEIGWNMLRETYSNVFFNGTVSATDPITEDDPNLALRLYDAGRFYLLVAAMVANDRGAAASTLSPKLAVVTLPVSLPVGTVGVQTHVATLVSSQVKVRRATTAGAAPGGRGSNTVSIPSGTLSTTILPKATLAAGSLTVSAPALIDVCCHNASTPLSLAVRQGGSVVLRLKALAPWRLGAPNVTINVTAFGVSVNATVLSLQPNAGLEVSALPTLMPGAYLLRFANVMGALPARRWVHVVKN
jgi:hypothetical protein